MNNIIKQANETIQRKIKRFINTLAKNAKIYDSFSQQQVNIIRDNIINLSEENNYWQEIFQEGGSSSDSTQSDNDDAQDNIVFQSECTKLFNLILQQSKEIDTPDQKNNDIKTPNKEQSEKSKDKKQSKSDEDLDKALNAANNKTSENTITLIVTSKNNFEFVNNKNERFQSKLSLQKLESFLKSNVNILKDKIQANKAERLQNQTKNIDAAIEFISNTLMNKSKTLKAYNGKLNKNTLKQILGSFDAGDVIWEKATADYNFGDRIHDRNQVQKMFYIISGSIICWYAATYFGKTPAEVNTNSSNKPQQQLNQHVDWKSLSSEQMANLIERKIKQAGKNPKDKSYLQSLLDNKNWNSQRTKKYEAALNILINRA